MGAWPQLSKGRDEQMTLGQALRAVRLCPSPRVLAGGGRRPQAPLQTFVFRDFRCHSLDHCRPENARRRGDGKQMSSLCRNASIFQGEVITHNGRVLHFGKQTKRQCSPKPNLLCRFGAALQPCLMILPGRPECPSPLEEKSFGHCALNITLR